MRKEWWWCRTEVLWVEVEVNMVEGRELKIEEKLFTEELINNFNLLRDGRRDQLLDMGYTPYMTKCNLKSLSFWYLHRRPGSSLAQSAIHRIGSCLFCRLPCCSVVVKFNH
jgi:hypothetical protein